MRYVPGQNLKELHQFVCCYLEVDDSESLTRSTMTKSILFIAQDAASGKVGDYITLCVIKSWSIYEMLYNDMGL